MFLIINTCTSFLCLKFICFSQPEFLIRRQTGVNTNVFIVSTVFWSNWVCLLNRSYADYRVWVTRTQNSTVHFEQQHKTQSHGTAQISCLGPLKKFIFKTNMRWRSKMVAMKKNRPSFNICSPWDLKISSNSFWATFWGKVLNNPAKAYLNYQPFLIFF